MQDELLCNLEDDLTKLKSHPDLVTLMLQSMKVRQHQRVMVDVQVHQHGSQLQNLLDSQCAIGWDKVRLGFWSAQWKNVQAQYAQERGIKQDAAHWAVASQLAVWRFVNGNWKYRNGRVHGNNIVDRQRVHRERMRREVQDVLDTEPVVGRSGRHLMEAAKTTLMQSYRQQKA